MNKRLLLIPPLVLAAVWWFSTPPEAAPVVPEEVATQRPDQRTIAPSPRAANPWQPEADEDTGASPLAMPEPVEAPLDTGDTGEALSPPLVTVWLVDTNGDPVDVGMVVSPECDIWVWVGGSEPTTFIGPEGLCGFQGRRRDGLLWGRSEWVDLDLAPGDEVELEMVIPIERTGGLGVMIAEHEFGIEVQRVWPGTPAAEMGLEAGDIITEVDGLPSSALTMDEFIQVMTGPVGTDVDFALAYEADTGFVEEDVTLTRAWLE